MKKIFQIFLNKAFLKFITIGIIITPLGMAIMFGMYNLIGLNYWLSTALSYIVNSTLSFLLNKYFTFSVKKWSYYFIFAYIVNIVCCYFLANFIAKRFIYWMLSSQNQIIRDNIAMIVGAVLFSVLNYLGQKYFVYKNKMDENEKHMKHYTLIGLTGPYCAGKNFVAKLLEERGFETLDLDTLGHRVIENEKKRIVEHFGSSILKEDGTVNRGTLGKLVFGKADELAYLESIVHPAVQKWTMEWIQDNSGKPKVINAALLHRSEAFDALELIIIVKAPWITRLFRAKKRDALPFFQLIKRFKSQKEFNSQYLTSNADIRNVNNRGYFNICSQIYKRNLETRIDAILAGKGR